MYDVELPASLVEFSTHARGEDGRRWLEQLPRLIRECEAHFGVQVKEAFTGGSQNCVLSCIRADGQPAVLKIGFRHETIEREAAALAHWPARVPQLLGYDASRSALLLDQIIEPTGRPQQASTAELAQVLKELHQGQLPDNQLPTLKDSQLDNLNRIDPKALSELGLADSILSEASALVERLSASEPVSVLLHGDVRPGNMLYDRDKGWILIDPDPQIGDPAYDAGFWALSTAGERTLLDQANHVASATRLETRRVLGWAWIAAIRHTYLQARINDRTAADLARHVTETDASSFGQHS